MSPKRIPLLILLVSIATSVVAQNACPLVVSTVLEAVSENCDDLGRNEICYGNNMLTALNFDNEPVDSLEDVGDTTDIFEIASIVTSPYDSNDEIWGIAILSLQADLPDTIAGQNVTFVVFGETELTSRVIPEDRLIESLSAISTGTINIRSGAGTNFSRVGALVPGQDIMLTGRNIAGDWVQIEIDDGIGWVFAELLDIDGDVSLLGIVDNDMNHDYVAPMQAFGFQTGIGNSGCLDVPPDGVLIQTPTNTTVNFLINGIEVEIGSTVFIQYISGRLVVTTLDGRVTVTSAGVSQIIEPGYTVYVSVAGEPGSPIEFQYDDFRSLPLLLLPEPVGIPVLVRSNNTWRDTGIPVDAGDTFTLRTGGLINFWDNCETEKVASGQPDIDCSSLIFDPAGGDPVTTSGAVLGSDMSLFPVPSAPPHSLVMRIGTSTTFVGLGGDFTAPESGTLEFRVNDVDLNNLGAFFVSVITP
ncbi:MAG: SH3 domain-containing protein [Anaerolineae bacterium]